MSETEQIKTWRLNLCLIALQAALGESEDIYAPVLGYHNFADVPLNVFNICEWLKLLHSKYQISKDAETKAIFLRVVQTASRIFSSEPRIWHVLGKFAESDKNFALAARSFERGLEFDATNIYLLMSAAQARFHCNHLDQASDHTQKLVIATNYQDDKALGLATQVALARGELDDAKRYSDLRRRLDPENRNEIGLGLATQVALARGELDDAKGYSDLRRRLDPENRDAIGLGLATQVALARGELDDAKCYSDLQRRLDPENRNEIGLGLATQVALARGELDDAKCYSDLQRRLDPENKDAIGLGLATQVALARGELDDAKCYSNILRRLDPENKDAIGLGLATQVALARGEYQSVHSLIGLIPPKKRNKVLLYMDAKAYFLEGEHGKAKQILLPLVQQNRDPAIITLFLATHEDGASELLTYRHVLGRDFDRLWKNSLDIRTKSGEITPSERELFFGYTFWTADAMRPVNTAALREMGVRLERV